MSTEEGQSGTPPVEDDGSIDDAERLYFRVVNTSAEINDDKDLGRERPTSGALEPDSDGVSVYLESDLIKLNLRPEAVVIAHDNYRVAWVTVASVRALGLGVVPDRDPPDAAPHPCNGAHHLIKGLPLARKKSLKTRQKLSKTGYVLPLGRAAEEGVDGGP